MLAGFGVCAPPLPSPSGGHCGTSCTFTRELYMVRFSGDATPLHEPKMNCRLCLIGQLVCAQSGASFTPSHVLCRPRRCAFPLEKCTCDQGHVYLSAFW
eukprot:gene18766-biopygen8424